MTEQTGKLKKIEDIDFDNVKITNTAGPPHPYLTREETNDCLETIGFSFVNPELLSDNQITKLKFAALEQLIAGAIAEWVAIQLDDPGYADTWEKVEAELRDWTKDWLVG